MYINGIRFIGLGGIGRRAAEPICRIVAYQSGLAKIPEITFIDGDAYEPRNIERQPCSDADASNRINKAQAAADEIKKLLGIDVVVYDDYIKPRNAPYLMRENDLIIAGVDSHAVRLLIAKYAEKLNDIVVVSGGNEMTDGGVQVFIRKGGHSITANLDEYHPEIANPEDKRPDELGCFFEQEIHPQLVRANNMAAAIMTNIVGELLDIEDVADFPYGEVYFDLKKNKVATAQREPTREEVKV